MELILGILIKLHTHKHHSCFIPEWVGRGISNITLKAHVLPKLFSYEKHYTADTTGGKPIAFQSQSISGVSALVL
jgi:hypothetical protein